MSASPLKVWLEQDGRLLRLRLDRPRANILDAAMIAALQDAFTTYQENAALTAILLNAEGSDFSFGVSVEEHLPDQCAAMLKGLHALIKAMLGFPKPILLAVRGQCLGGGLEVALAGDLLFVADHARLGQPEIKLGVFAPAASCLLPRRIGQARATDLLLSGRSIGGDEAAAIGLATAVSSEPQQSALAYITKHLAPKSASSLGHALKAARAGFTETVKSGLYRLECLYLEGLMSTRDAVEGLQAFLTQRSAVWENC
jgi:cyclohexa-1,5-dienecarbonyl-CoA hydratase